MKRAHRRLHLLIWLALLPGALIASVIFLSGPTVDPFDDLPGAIATETP